MFPLKDENGVDEFAIQSEFDKLNNAPESPFNQDYLASREATQKATRDQWIDQRVREPQDIPARAYPEGAYRINNTGPFMDSNTGISMTPAGQTDVPDTVQPMSRPPRPPAAKLEEFVADPTRDYTPKNRYEAIVMGQIKAGHDALRASSVSNANRQAQWQQTQAAIQAADPVEVLKNSKALSSIADPDLKDAISKNFAADYPAHKAAVKAEQDKRRAELGKPPSGINLSTIEEDRKAVEAYQLQGKLTGDAGPKGGKTNRVGVAPGIMADKAAKIAAYDKWKAESDAIDRLSDEGQSFLQRPDVKDFMTTYSKTRADYLAAEQVKSATEGQSSTASSQERDRDAASAARNMSETMTKGSVLAMSDVVAATVGGRGMEASSNLKQQSRFFTDIGAGRETGEMIRWVEGAPRSGLTQSQQAVASGLKDSAVMIPGKTMKEIAKASTLTEFNEAVKGLGADQRAVAIFSFEQGVMKTLRNRIDEKAQEAIFKTRTAIPTAISALNAAISDPKSQMSMELSRAIADGKQESESTLNLFGNAVNREISKITGYPVSAIPRLLASLSAEDRASISVAGNSFAIALSDKITLNAAAEANFKKRANVPDSATKIKPGVYVSIPDTLGFQKNAITDKLQQLESWDPDGMASEAYATPLKTNVNNETVVTYSVSPQQVNRLMKTVLPFSVPQGMEKSTAAHLSTITGNPEILSNPTKDIGPIIDWAFGKDNFDKLAGTQFTKGNIGAEFRAVFKGNTDGVPAEMIASAINEDPVLYGLFVSDNTANKKAVLVAALHKALQTSEQKLMENEKIMKSSLSNILFTITEDKYGSESKAEMAAFSSNIAAFNSSHPGDANYVKRSDYLRQEVERVVDGISQRIDNSLKDPKFDPRGLNANIEQELLNLKKVSDMDFSSSKKVVENLTALSGSPKGAELIRNRQTLIDAVEAIHKKLQAVIRDRGLDKIDRIMSVIPANQLPYIPVR